MSLFKKRFTTDSPHALLLLVVIVGVAAGVGAAIFHASIVLMTEVWYGASDGAFVEAVTALPGWWRVLVPTLGGLLVGLLFYFVRVREAEGEGVPEVVEALALRHGTIRPIVAPVKIVAAALTLSSGGSAGREGPVIQIGSAIGSWIGQLGRLPERERSLLLACGAAAAIGGAFGAPFAGVVFTIEILRHRPEFLRTGLILVAALVGAWVTTFITGHAGLRFEVDALPVFAWWPYGLAALGVGVAAAIVAVVFGMVLRGARIFFTVWPLPPYVRPALGGFVVGCIGLLLPYIHEPAAYPLMIDLMVFTELSFAFLLTLLVVKMLATGVTLGSGGVGGIFAPSLLLGALLGSMGGVVALSYGLIEVAALPLFVCAGMAAVFAAAAHAPITATLITYEMVGLSELIIPLLIATFSATYVARMLHQESVYTH